MDNYIEITDDHKLKTSEIFKKLKEKVGVWSYWDNQELDKKFPAPKETTTRYFLKQVESENKGKSANEVDPDGTKGITLREYALMQILFFTETGGCLDVEGWTICSGSRLHSGRVALGYWNSGSRRVGFCWRSPFYQHSDGGARLAISPSNLNPFSLNSSDSTLKKAIEICKKAGLVVYEVK